MTVSRKYLQYAAILVGATLFYAMGAALLSHLAHADPPGAVPAVVEQPPSILAIIAIALAGLSTLLSGLSTILHTIAPRTKTTVDDRIAVGVDSVHAKLDEVLGVVRAIHPAAAPPAPPVVVVNPPGNTVSGSVGLRAVLLLGALATLQTGCTSTAQRASTLGAAKISVDASREAFLAYDAAHQTEIVADAASLEAGKAALTEYRAKRGVVEKSFIVAYNAIAVALTLNDDPSLTGAKAALQQVIAAVQALTGGAK